MKKTKLTSLEVFLAAAAGVAALLLAWTLLTMQPAAVQGAAAPNPKIMDRFDAAMTNAKSDALDGVMQLEKRYWLSDDASAGPVPDPAKFGTASDPGQLQWLLDEAAPVLEGQELYFSTDKELAEGSEIHYYLDETIFAIVWKEVHDSCVYTCAEVKIMHPSQLRRHLSGGEFGSEKQSTTTEMAAEVNAVLASAGDFYIFRKFGGIVYDGTARRLVARGSETCCIDENGDLNFLHAHEVETLEELQAYVDEHNIRFSLAFGPILVENGALCPPADYELGEVKDRYARSALCQMGKLHYLVVNANAEEKYTQHPTIRTFAGHIAATGCDKAYTLDGGQTATIAMNGQVLNHVSYGSQRKTSDIIYFATAVPNGG